MGGKYKSTWKCGGRKHKVLDDPDSEPGTHQRPKDAIKTIHLYVLSHEMLPGQRPWRKSR